jgi:hypothetical protein
MNTNRRRFRASLIIALMISLTAARARLRADSGICGSAGVNLPSTDVAGNTFFCQIGEAYFSGLTGGVTHTTYDPSSQ